MSVRRFERAPVRNTFGVDARVDLLIETDDADDLPGLFADELAGTSPQAFELLILGGGSNLLIVEAPAVALHLDSQRIEVLDARTGIVRADAGVEWHRFVMWTLEHGFAGLENLALIPGTVGASPIQNIGAYGVEAGERIHAVDVFERASGVFQRLDAQACGFAYRDSVFKHDPDRWLVTAVEFKLAPSLETAALKLDYAGIRDELASMGIATPDARDVAEAVIGLRRGKLPDPAVVGNAGSFFKNPIVPVAQADALKSEHAALPVFPGSDADTRKLSAAWLIDACGWKGRRGGDSGDAGVSDKHALVLVNHGHATGAELLTLARGIAASVHARFGVAIEPEPRIVGARW
ncbi:MAG: UDP-N-acetylmuramate dehydrogenase [Lysobacteraceae bacterium]